MKSLDGEKQVSNRTPPQKKTKQKTNPKTKETNKQKKPQTNKQTLFNENSGDDGRQFRRLSLQKLNPLNIVGAQILVV